MDMFRTLQQWKNNWLLLHYNVACHTCLVVQQFWWRAKMQPHSAIFPRCHSCNFWLFPRIKTGLKGHRFLSVGKIQCKTTAGLIAIPKGLQRCSLAMAEPLGQVHTRRNGSALRVTNLGFINILFTINYASTLVTVTFWSPTCTFTI
jgi:hypothetical protein